MSTIESSRWAVVQTRGTDLVLGSGIAYDGAGGALVTGYFSGHASFGSTFLTSRGTEDAFVMHVTASGAIDWAVQAGDRGLYVDQDDHDSSSTSHDPGYCIAHDGAGGAFVTGFFMDGASFGSTLLKSLGLVDAFVMHVTASGAIDWAVQAGGENVASGRGIAHDGAGGALVTGYFSGQASFGSTSLTSRGTTDAFVMHVTASGAIDWAVQAGGESATSGRGIAHDGAGGALVTGYFKQMVDSRRLPVASFGSTSLTAQGSADAFVMHVTASGAIDWAVQAGGADTNTGGYGIAHDGAGGAPRDGLLQRPGIVWLDVAHQPRQYRCYCDARDGVGRHRLGRPGGWRVRGPRLGHRARWCGGCSRDGPLQRPRIVRLDDTHQP